MQPVEYKYWQKTYCRRGVKYWVQEPGAIMLLAHIVMLRKEDAGDSNSAPAKMSSRLALGDDAESSPTNLTAATNTDTNDAKKLC